MQVSMVYVGNATGLNWVIVFDGFRPGHVLDKVGRMFHGQVTERGRDVRDFMKEMRSRYGRCAIYEAAEWERICSEVGIVPISLSA